MTPEIVLDYLNTLDVSRLNIIDAGCYPAKFKYGMDILFTKPTFWMDAVRGKNSLYSIISAVPELQDQDLHLVRIGQGAGLKTFKSLRSLKSRTHFVLFDHGVIKNDLKDLSNMGFELVYFGEEDHLSASTHSKCNAYFYNTALR